MAIIKCFFTIVLKHINIICIYLAVFISLCAGFSVQSRDLREKIFTLQAVNFTVSDKDNSTLSKAVIQSLDRDNNLVKFADSSAETIKDALYNQEIEYALFIPEGFEESFNAGGDAELNSARASGSLSSEYLDNRINRFLNIYHAYAAAGYNNYDAAENALKQLGVKGEVNMLAGAGLSSPPPVFYYFNFLAYALMTVMMMGLSPILKLFLDPGAAVRLNCSPVPAAKVNLSLAAASAIFACVCFLTLYLYGIICYGDAMFTESSEICLLGALCFVPCCMGLAYLIAHAAKNPATVNAAGNAVSIAFCFIGGVYVPLEIMSDEILNVAKFTPAYHYIKVVSEAWKYSDLSPAQLSEIYAYMGLELLFGAAFFAAALAVSVRKRER